MHKNTLNIPVVNHTFALHALTFLAVLAVGCAKKTSFSEVDTTHGSSITQPTTSSASAGQNAQASPKPSSFDAKKVSLQYLPDSVRPFVAKNYPDYTIVSATFDPLCGGAPAIDVAIRAKAKPAYSVIFLPDGHYIQREQDVPLSSIPASVRASVKAKYGGFRPGKQAEELILADNTTEYSLDLFKPHEQQEAIFSATGEVVCAGKE